MRRFFRIFLLCLNILTAVLLLVSAYGGHVNPLKTTLPGMLLMVFPGLLLLSVLLLGIDFFRWRKLMFVQGFAILLSAPAIWNICPLNFFSNKLKDGERELKVMTYNVYYFVDETRPSPGDADNRSMNTIIRENPDIVLLQESREGDLPDWDDLRPQADTLAACYPYRVVHGSMAIWSKYPLRAVCVKQYPDPSSLFLVADVDVGGYPLTVYNVHLQSLSLSDTDKALYYNMTNGSVIETNKQSTPTGLLRKVSYAMERRAEQAILLRSQIDSLSRRNVIVAGDFNDIADCWAQRTIMGRDIKSTFSAVGFGPTISYNAFRFYFNIDHVLYGGDIRPLRIHRGRERSSDHYPVTATFAIPHNE